MSEAVVQAVRDASVRGAPLRVTGAGTWLDAGRPVAPDSYTLSLADHSGIVEYEPGDLTLTARAGTPLSDIETATRANGQFLALDPFGSPAGTIGATAATASYGPLGNQFGGPRDAVIGLQFVTGDGLVVRGGGRVVKNVAGFDLVRLLIGSWGTIGVLTEVSVRLRALPAADLTLAVPLPTGRMAIASLLAGVSSAAIVPWSAELVNDEMAATLGLERRPQLLLRLAGNEESVTSQRAAVASLGDSGEISAEVWPAMRSFEQAIAADAVVRISSRPSRLPDVWLQATTLAASASGMAHATLSRGVARVAMKGGGAMLHDTLAAGDGLRVIAERLPPGAWSALPAADDPLSRSLRRKFDPAGVLNPGLLGE